MPEPFKNLFNETVITGMGGHFARAWPDFDQVGFVATATDNLDALELKQRSDQITAAMAAFLPADFEHATAVMLASLAPADEHGFKGDDGILFFFKLKRIYITQFKIGFFNFTQRNVLVLLSMGNRSNQLRFINR